MAEGATTLKGLRAQMGKLKTRIKKTTLSNAMRSCVVQHRSRFGTCADKCRLAAGFFFGTSCYRSELLALPSLARRPGACLPTMDAENVRSESNH